MPMRLLIVVLLALPLVRGQAEISLRDTADLERWLEFIHPSEAELVYEQIGWRNRFWPAVEEARRLGRPILLWTMNGHPLGCT